MAGAAVTRALQTAERVYDAEYQLEALWGLSRLSHLHRRSSQGPLD